MPLKKIFDLLIEEKGVTVITQNLPAIKAVPIQMHQLFNNLMSNAIKFSSTNPVIEITAEPLSPLWQRSTPG